MEFKKEFKSKKNKKYMWYATVTDEHGACITRCTLLKQGKRWIAVDGYISNGFLPVGGRRIALEAPTDEALKAMVVLLYS